MASDNTLENSQANCAKPDLFTFNPECNSRVRRCKMLKTMNKNE